jgi:phosphopantetheinyl transferase
MPLLRQYESAGVDVLVWKITETVDGLLGMVPAECAALAKDKFASEKRCREWLAVRAMVSQHFGEDARIGYDESGKPCLDGMGGRLSISHTDGYAVMAYSRNKEIGVDVELVSRNVMSAATRFMQPDVLDAHRPGERNFVALVHWCAKEALYKRLDISSMADFKRAFSIAPYVLSTQGTLHATICDVEEHVELNYRIFPHFVYVCTK